MADPNAAPPLRWLFAGTEQRRAAWRYWGRDTAVGLLSLAVYSALRLLPIDTPWVLGRRLGDLLRTRVFPATAQRMRDNWAWLRPEDNDPAVVEAAVTAAFRNAAAVYLEYAVLDRIWRAGRIAVEGTEHVAAARAASRPVLVAALHMGNWEIPGPAALGLGYGVAAVHRVAANRFNHRIVVDARKRYGVRLIAPDRAGAREAIRVLTERNEVLAIYIDEYTDGRVAAPAFGRPIRSDDNIAYAARLAAMTGAAVLPAYVLRGKGVRFRMILLPPVPMVQTGDRAADAMANAERINAAVEPIVRAHLDQWLHALYLRRDK